MTFNSYQRENSVAQNYGIKKKDSETGKMEWYDPTEGKGDDEDNIVDPQSWVAHPLGDAWRSAHEAYESGNTEEMMRWLQEYERLLDKEDGE